MLGEGLLRIPGTKYKESTPAPAVRTLRKHRQRADRVARALMMVRDHWAFSYTMIESRIPVRQHIPKRNNPHAIGNLGEQYRIELAKLPERVARYFQLSLHRRLAHFVVQIFTQGPLTQELRYPLQRH